MLGYGSLIGLVKNNPWIASGLGLGAATWVVNKSKELCTVTLTVYSEDRIFSYVNRWLGDHPSTAKMTRLNLASWYERTSDSDEFTLTPGEGTHLLWYKGKPFLVTRVVQDDNKNGDTNNYQRRQSITITTLGRSQQTIRDFLDEIRRVQLDSDTIAVSMWNGSEYFLIERRSKRSLDTVYCAPGLKENVLTDVQTFFASRDNYHHDGIPYRRGYLLEGPPGTGKTTLIYALASMMEKPVFLLNPTGLDNDNQLHHAVNAARDGFLVIEDIDSLRASENRETAERPEIAGEASKSGVTLSGLLNALDGIGTREGNVLFLTSNTPEILDPALLRAGRIDRRFRLDKAGETEARAMFTRLNPSGNVENFLAGLNLPCSQADIQNMILSDRGG